MGLRLRGRPSEVRWNRPNSLAGRAGSCPAPTGCETWKWAASGPQTFGPFRIQRAGRGRIAFVCDPAWTHFRALPRHRANRAKVWAADRTESASDLFNRGMRLLDRKLQEGEEMPIPSAPEASDPYGERMTLGSALLAGVAAWRTRRQVYRRRAEIATASKAGV